MTDRIRLVVLFGGESAEHDVSCVTARHVLSAANPDRYDVLPVGITRDGNWVVADEAMAALEAGERALPERLAATGSEVEPTTALASATASERVVVFPLLHGPRGEDGTVQGLLDLANVPYVGTGVLGSALAMDKAKAKEVLAYHGIPQAAWVALHATEVGADTPDSLAKRLGLPVFVKPANLGSSIGVTKAHDPDGLRDALAAALRHDEWLVVEESIEGREIECAVLGNENPRVSVPGEIVPGAEFYDYEDKYEDGSAELLIPAPLPGTVTEEFQGLALRVFKLLRAEGLARVDFFYEEDGRGPLLNEINTIPGFTPISMYPRLWEASGLSYADLVDELVRLAVERHERRARYRTVTREEPGSARPGGQAANGRGKPT